MTKGLLLGDASRRCSSSHVRCMSPTCMNVIAAEAVTSYTMTKQVWLRVAQLPVETGSVKGVRQQICYNLD